MTVLASTMHLSVLTLFLVALGSSAAHLVPRQDITQCTTQCEAIGVVLTKCGTDEACICSPTSATAFAECVECSSANTANHDTAVQNAYNQYMSGCAQDGQSVAPLSATNMASSTTGSQSATFTSSAATIQGATTSTPSSSIVTNDASSPFSTTGGGATLAFWLSVAVLGSI